MYKNNFMYCHEGETQNRYSVKTVTIILSIFWELIAFFSLFIN